MKDTGPDYKKIYIDIIEEKFPDKLDNSKIMQKIETINTVIDIIALNRMIFGEQELLMESKNQKLRSYDERSILNILEYQKKNKLNNTQTANYFRMSRNTLSKWKRIFKI
ncbi:helix-turn-helix domain-containing protein [Chryseobacterium lathyri]|uniref:DNA-binding transcriptional regulator YiaG n=1 Tax=Chryseobacterium lathyri TaxID=395933 RepID=A0ABT9SGE3_9FLAO|nr:helix-turn-helix domain-containing protein [Chryseobacterium lathyri]MDP9958488.1 DNA-binding transcriptional regulator YiaG [Chryseobacterium lathyri]MDQ0066523.1 DNA-binding transcriptional regulator YiaG [Chryseobacterium lathyri]